MDHLFDMTTQSVCARLARLQPPGVHVVVGMWDGGALECVAGTAAAVSLAIARWPREWQLLVDAGWSEGFSRVFVSSVCKKRSCERRFPAIASPFNSCSPLLSAQHEALRLKIFFVSQV